jgi:hypothetical protein
MSRKFRSESNEQGSETLGPGSVPNLPILTRKNNLSVQQYSNGRYFTRYGTTHDLPVSRYGTELYLENMIASNCVHPVSDLKKARTGFVYLQSKCFLKEV